MGEVLGALLLGALLSRETQHCPHSPQAIRQKHTQVFLIPLSVLKPLFKWFSSPLEGTPVGFRVAVLLRQLSPSGSGYVVLSLHVVVQEDGCRVTLNRGGVQEGTHPESGFSVHPLGKQKFAVSAFPVTVQHSSISRESVLG